MKHYHIGYTQGVYDMFHVGHLNLINNAKKYCDILIVGINSDELVQRYKHKNPVINQDNRCLIVSNIKAVDKAIIVNTLDKVEIHNNTKFDAIFIGDDWKGNVRWEETEKQLAQIGVDLVYLPYTQNISSTLLRSVEKNSIDDKYN